MGCSAEESLLQAAHRAGSFLVAGGRGRVLGELTGLGVSQGEQGSVSRKELMSVPFLRRRGAEALGREPARVENRGGLDFSPAK